MIPREAPADLDPALAGDARGHRVEAGEADELAGVAALDRPQSVAVGVEARLEAVDRRVALFAREGRDEVAPHLGVGIQRSEGLSVL